MKHKKAGRLSFTQKALDDLLDIEAYSIEQWGKGAAQRYVADLRFGFDPIRDRPELLESIADAPPFLKYYRVNKHLVVCDVRETSLVVLAVFHASMDLPRRVMEIRPTLAMEVELLHNELQRGEPRPPWK